MFCFCSQITTANPIHLQNPDLLSDGSCGPRESCSCPGLCAAVHVVGSCHGKCCNITWPHETQPTAAVQKPSGHTRWTSRKLIVKCYEIICSWHQCKVCKGMRSPCIWIAFSNCMYCLYFCFVLQTNLKLWFWHLGSISD